MEISRKKISTADLIAKERELVEKITEINERYSAELDSLGCESVLEFVKIGEYDDEYTDIDFAEENYKNGYVSRALITVREKAVDEAPIELDREEYESDEAYDVAKNALAAQSEREREVARTEIMLMRIYKTFWVETVSLCEDVSPIDADLCEFVGKIKERNA
ncbi:MAG: hypothetical protein IJQ37_03040 [Clostridia bacterium]|nr:hypothetical protein [Clostridia bacterium]